MCSYSDGHINYLKSKIDDLEKRIKGQNNMFINIQEGEFVNIDNVNYIYRNDDVTIMYNSIDGENTEIYCGETEEEVNEVYNAIKESLRNYNIICCEDETLVNISKIKRVYKSEYCFGCNINCDIVGDDTVMICSYKNKEDFDKMYDLIKEGINKTGMIDVKGEI